jgi:hypothetical protein
VAVEREYTEFVASSSKMLADHTWVEQDWISKYFLMDPMPILAAGGRASPRLQMDEDGVGQKAANLTAMNLENRRQSASFRRSGHRLSPRRWLTSCKVMERQTI